MKYIDAIKGSLIALAIFVITVIYIPGKGTSHEIEIILTISTFLFAILAGFFISRSNSRYNSIRESMAKEDADWSSLYQTSKLLGKKFQDKVRELTDTYYIIAYDFDLGEYYKYNAKYLHTVYDELNKIKDKLSKGSLEAFSSIIDILSQIEEDRNISSVLTEEKVPRGQWGILFILSGIILFSIFYLKTSEIYSQIITVMLSTILILVILILRDLQNGRIGGLSFLAESGQEVFEFMGKLRYHNIRHLKDGSESIPKHIKKYRLGTHKPGETPKIKIVKNE